VSNPTRSSPIDHEPRFRIDFDSLYASLRTSRTSFLNIEETLIKRLSFQKVKIRQLRSILIVNNRTCAYYTLLFIDYCATI
jgi:hypothetical protein